MTKNLFWFVHQSMPMQFVMLAFETYEGLLWLEESMWQKGERRGKEHPRLYSRSRNLQIMTCFKIWSAKIILSLTLYIHEMLYGVVWPSFSWLSS